MNSSIPNSTLFDSSSENTTQVDAGLSTNQHVCLYKPAINASDLAELSQDRVAWHQKIGAAYGYDKPSANLIASILSESFRIALKNALQTGNWAQLGLGMTAVPSEQLRGRSAIFLAGNMVIEENDRIVINQDLLHDATYSNAAKNQLIEGIMEAVMYALESKIQKAKTRDM